MQETAEPDIDAVFVTYSAGEGRPYALTYIDHNHEAQVVLRSRSLIEGAASSKDHRLITYYINRNGIFTIYVIDSLLKQQVQVASLEHRPSMVSFSIDNACVVFRDDDDMRQFRKIIFE